MKITVKLSELGLAQPTRLNMYRKLHSIRRHAEKELRSLYGSLVGALHVFNYRLTYSGEGNLTSMVQVTTSAVYYQLSSSVRLCIVPVYVHRPLASQSRLLISTVIYGV